MSDATEKYRLSRLVEDYFALQKELHEAFGYVKDYVVIPLDDRREMHWMIVDRGCAVAPTQDATGEGYNSMCVWSSEPFTEESIMAGEKIYSGPIYTQRFLAKWVYRANRHAMVAVDTRTDGNKLLMIFDEDKECVDNALRTLYRERWKDWRHV